MPKFVKTVRTWISGCFLLLIAFPGNAVAVPVDERELGRWVPSLSLVVGLNAQSAEGHVGTSDVVGPPVGTRPPGFNLQPIIPGSPATDRQRMMTPFAGAGIELMTPAWFDVPTRPRAFAHFDVAVAFGPTYVMPNIGNIGPLRPSPTSGGQTESTVLGQGARTEAVVEPLLLFAGAGIALTTEVSGRALRIKPSFEYMREQIQISGSAQRAVRLTAPSPTLNEFRQILLVANRTVTYHGIGPGLELELDTGRAGPFVVSLYGAGKAWAFIDNEKQNLEAENVYGEQASFTFLKNKWAFGGAVGLRFRWVPE